jgi:hypothetical protein
MKRLTKRPDRRQEERRWNFLSSLCFYDFFLLLLIFVLCVLCVCVVLFVSDGWFCWLLLLLRFWWWWMMFWFRWILRVRNDVLCCYCCCRVLLLQWCVLVPEIEKEIFLGFEIVFCSGCYDESPLLLLIFVLCFIPKVRVFWFTG